MKQPETAQPIAASAAAMSAMLQHLRRSGVEFLPHADVERVRQLSSQTAAKATSEQSEIVTKPSTTPPSPQALPLRSGSRLSPAPVAHAATVPRAEPYTGAKLPIGERSLLLAAIANEVTGCIRCETLACQRNQTVPGEGNPQARVCFLGEAPGADEDASGRPFVGRAGQLLTKMIEACTFTRDDVFILNTIKCRPPGNRNPEHGEIENCRCFLERQLEIIQPEYIVCLGLIAAQAILHTKLSVGRLRGQFHAYRSSKVLVTYHPSYLLREPAVKKAAWADLQFLLHDMGIKLPVK